MPSKSTFQHYDLSFNNKKTFTVELFKGVDYTPAQLSVSKDHATDILNIIFKDKMNQKRTGWETMAKVATFNYRVEDENGNIDTSVNGIKTNTTNINGVWQFYGEDNRLHTVVHIGRLLYVAEFIGKNYTFLDTKLTVIAAQKTIGLSTYTICKELLDIKSNAFVSNKRLYILGGTKFYVLKFVDNQPILSEVEDEPDTYIPTTLIGKTYKDSSVPSGSPLDDINLMTMFRKNGLVSGTYIDDGVTLRTTRYWDWELDGSIKGKKPTDINKVVIKISQLKEVA